MVSHWPSQTHRILWISRGLNCRRHHREGLRAFSCVRVPTQRVNSTPSYPIGHPVMKLFITLVGSLSRVAGTHKPEARLWSPQPRLTDLAFYSGSSGRVGGDSCREGDPPQAHASAPYSGLRQCQQVLPVLRHQPQDLRPRVAVGVPRDRGPYRDRPILSLAPRRKGDVPLSALSYDTRRQGGRRQSLLFSGGIPGGFLRRPNRGAPQWPQVGSFPGSSGSGPAEWVRTEAAA